jgi:peptidoglycan/xylan/chitin deacetylase (PgdA/CDA1 family)
MVAVGRLVLGGLPVNDHVASPRAACRFHAFGRRVPVLSSAFLVEIPPQWRSEREYALRVLFGDWLGVRYSVRVSDDLDETRVCLASEPDGATIAIPDVLLARSTEWLSPGSLPPAILPTVGPPAWAELEGRLPILFDGGAGAGDLVRRDGSRFVLRLDLLGSLVFMLARYEEHVDPRQRDEHGRFPATASALGSSGWLQWPILDMYLHIFVALARLAWPRVALPPLKGPGVVLGHDVDHPSSSIRWHGRERLRKVGGDLFRRRDVGLAVRRASSFLPGASAVSRFDPYNTYSFLMQTSEAAGLRSTFFFLAKDTEIPYGSRYRLDDGWAARLVAEIAERGHHIGLHGSYDSSNDAGRLREERVLLEHACRGLPPGVLRRTVRQHYLRQHPGDTWRAQVEAGLIEDESLGFADAIGYRAGTARSFPAYDLANHRQLPLRIKPLHVMDGTLLEYMSLDETEAFSMVAAMSGRTRTFGGDFSILWHNSTLEAGRTRRLYLDLVRELTV